MKPKEALCAIATGMGLIFAFPPFYTGFLALFALVPFFMLLKGKGYCEAMIYAYFTGFIFSAGTLYWVVLPTVAGGIALILFLPVFFSLFSVIFLFFYRCWGEHSLWLVPFYWTAIEWMRSLGEIAFPWLTLGYTQTYYTPMIQYADITGVYGVSFWIVLINVMVYFLVHYRDNVKKILLLSGAILLLVSLPLVHGHFVIPNEDLNPDVKIALIQGNIDPYAKWDKEFVKDNFAIYQELTWLASKQTPHLIIWPETAAPCYLKRHSSYRNIMHAFVDSIGIPLVTGAPDYVYRASDHKVLYYNSAFFFQPFTKEFRLYNKIQLVPFSEKIPFEDHIPVLQKINLGEADFSYGTEFTVFNSSAGTFAVLICFESIFPELVRTFVNKGCHFLINITNDGWFGKTSGPYQHAQMAVFRAIENRIGIARCANSGISQFVDAWGRVYNRTSLFKREIAVNTLKNRNKPKSFYSRYGDIFAKVCAGISLCIFMARVAVWQQR